MSAARGLLSAVLLLALGVRVWGIGFGLPLGVARPDETQIAGSAVGFLSGNLRPPFLEWPTLFAYAVALTYVAMVAAMRPFSGPATLADFAEIRRVSLAPFLYPSRVLSAVMGVMTVWWLYAIGRRVFDHTVAIVAAVFLALAFLHVRDSHFGLADVPMTALVVLAVLAILRWRDSGTLTDAAMAGLAGGLATSTKYNALGVLVPFAVALGQRLVEEWRLRTDAFWRALRAAAMFGVCVALALFGTSPYIVIDWPRFVSNVTATGSMLAAGHGMVLGRGWWYFAQVVLPAAVGWPIFVAGVAGTGLLLVTRFRESAVVLAFPIAYYLVAGRGFGVFARYMLPVVPFLCLTAAWLVVTAVRAVVRSGSPALQRALIAAATVAMVAPSAYRTVLLDRLLSTPDNRVVAGRALIDILPENSLVYQSGEPMGHAMLSIDGKPAALRTASYDNASGTFAPADPDWIIVQRSPLVLYSSVPASLERVLAERYTLARAFSTESRTDVVRTYDQQDAFYLPLAGLEGIRRPGPAFELYQRRQ
jgi:hypothetical protein